MTFSKEFDELVKHSRETAIEFGWSFISSYHFLIGILKSDNLPNIIFKNKNWEFEQLSKSLIKEKNKLKTCIINYFSRCLFGKFLRNFIQFVFFY